MKTACLRLVLAGAQPLWGLFMGRGRRSASCGLMETWQRALGVLILNGLAAALLAPSAMAQFDKSPWPLHSATPQWDVSDLQGKTWGTPDLASKVVVLNFWATWCAPCKFELPTLQTLHEISGSDTVVLSINVREPAARVQRYVKSAGLTFPVIPDPKGELAQRWGVTVYPTTVLIGPSGQARWRVMGDVDWSGAEANAWLSEVRKR